MLIVLLIWVILCRGSTFYSHPRLVLSPLLLEMWQQLRYQVVIFCIEKVALLPCGERAVLWTAPGVLGLCVNCEKLICCGDGALPSMLHGAPFIISDTYSCIEISMDPGVKNPEPYPGSHASFPLFSWKELLYQIRFLRAILFGQPPSFLYGDF